MPKITTDDRARQGPSGKPMLIVLVSALALCILAGAGYLMWTGATSPDSATQNASREAVTGSPTGSSAGNPGNRTPPANPSYPTSASPTATGSTTR